MNWVWHLRSGDGGMNGLEFALALTAGDKRRVLVHAAPSQLQVDVRTDDGQPIVGGGAKREGDYSPITLLALGDDEISRDEVWPTAEHIGLPVILPGGEVGILTSWHNAEDKSWWKWSVELSNHKERPADWAPPPS